MIERGPFPSAEVSDDLFRRYIKEIAETIEDAGKRGDRRVILWDMDYPGLFIREEELRREARDRGWWIHRQRARFSVSW